VLYVLFVDSRANSDRAENKCVRGMCYIYTDIDEAELASRMCILPFSRRTVKLVRFAGYYHLPAPSGCSAAPANAWHAPEPSSWNRPDARYGRRRRGRGKPIVEDRLWSQRAGRQPCRGSFLFFFFCPITYRRTHCRSRRAQC